MSGQLKTGGAATPGSMVVVDGELDANTAPRLGASLHRLIDVGAPSITLDCTDLAFIDSQGLGVLVGVSRRLREGSGSLHLHNAGSQLRRVLQLTKLDQVFVVD